MTPTARVRLLATALIGVLTFAGPPTDSAGVAGELPAARSPEPWADSRLKVTRGLVLWLDATRLDPGREAMGLKPLRGGDAVDTWPDASGQGLHLSQPDAAARPAYQDANGFRAVRFDGERTFLVHTRAGTSYREVTIFIVAAPFANPGQFRAFLAVNETGKNDFVTGLTLDQGPVATPRFQALNAEGAGFGGAVSLMREAKAFGEVQRLCVTSAAGAGGTKLFVNGKPQGQRDRGESVLRMDQVRVGARHYALGGPPQTQGFLDGDVAEVLVYDRVLGDSERAAVDAYLAAKYGEARKIPPPVRAVVGKPLVAVADPPPVQMFIPGFTVKELPVDLTNINNVQYRPDGKLVALAYNGNVYLLSDTDGDGLEDRAELFWEGKGGLRAPIGMALTPPGYKHGDGLFVACKGKCSLIVDTDGDGKADKEIVVAEGWKELPHGVDALGVAFDPRDGSVYFGLGCANFTNAYQVGPDGKAGYRLASERGTILRVAPDFRSREVIATGIRFSVGLRFNRAGDLFCTDQEGATWLPNGNPLDELLHIQRGRHYGFPPRHPRYLPRVIDDPSVFDYAPQHQSTCGLNFNEPVNGGPVFGPPWWQSDALVAGYSRGKLFRTKLVHTAGGYMAQSQLLAALTMLACDVCVSPRGELVIATHSGGPDWGSGPEGRGKLYKVFYTGRDLPQPVLAWAQSPREVRVAFDRPIDPRLLKNVAAKASIEYGRYVSAGDRFESLWPGYQVVQDQLRAPRHGLPVVGVQVTADGRTLILATAPHPEAVNYALTLPGLGRPARAVGQERELGQVPETDLRYDLCGVEAAWEPKDGDGGWTGWLPHLDLDAARGLTTASATHDALWERWRRPGTLVLRTKLRLKDMLRPAVQPGSKIDYDWPAEDVTLTFQSTRLLEVKAAAQNQQGHHLSITVSHPTDAPVLLELRLATGESEPDLHVTYHTNEDARPRALPLHRLLLPWSSAAGQDASATARREIPELAGGDWARGRAVFYSDQAACSKCHTVRGRGGSIGPDLTNLTQRDYPSVVRDITEPSFAINPDYITQVLYLKDGRVLSGAVRTLGDQLLVGDQEGKVTTVSRGDVTEIESSPKSIMPEGILQLLGPEKTRDLLTFLLTEPPHMPDDGPGKPPEPRTLNEVRAVLAGAPDRLKMRPIHVVLVSGAKDHGPGEHDYPAWQRVWKQLLAMADETRVTTADDWPSAADLKTADVLVFYQHGTWTPQRAKDIDAFLARGGGLVYVHFAVDGGADAPGLARRIGLAWQGGRSKFRHGPLDLGFRTDTNHPVARNFDKVHFHDESYWGLVGDVKRVNLLATGVEEGQEQPLFWTLEPARGRVFVSIPGHYAWTFDDPLFRTLLLRGIAWAAKEPVDRFNELVTAGARIKE
jgi:putative heme-binding domain-containing protein